MVTESQQLCSERGSVEGVTLSACLFLRPHSHQVCAFSPGNPPTRGNAAGRPALLVLSHPTPVRIT
eukprot:1139955-Pelagomonas_calceolata.AAC.8